MRRLPILVLVGLLAISPIAHASVKSSLVGLKSVLVGSILPFFAVLGLSFALLLESELSV